LRDLRHRLILTPEQVEVRLAPAGAGSRFLALIVDGLIALSLSVFLGQLLMPLLPAGLGYALWATLNFVISWGYHVYFETYQDGRSPGKRLLGLRVVDGRGLPVAFQQAFVRNVMRILDGVPAFYALGALVCQLDGDGRRLGDLAADTLVVRERRSAEATRELARSLEQSSLRTPRLLRLLGRRLGLEEREFLLDLSLRAAEMEPKARFDLMEEVAAHYRQRLEIEGKGLSGENLVRGLTALLFWDRRGEHRGALAARMV